MDLREIEPLTKNKKYLVFDISNIAYSAFYVHKGESLDVLVGLAAHTLLNMMLSYYNKFSPDVIIMGCDRKNWRLAYTKSSKCVSGKEYKGDRHKDMSISEKEKYDLFKKSLADFEEMIDKHTKIITLASIGCEADDLIAAFTQIYSKSNDVIIISRDQDYIQLLQYPNVKLYDPVAKQYHSLDEWDNDVDKHLFIKCIRGGEDNIQSAYPRIWKTKLDDAWEDPFLMTNIMKHKWTGKDKKEFLVEDLYKENQLLMDLTKQPDNIKQLMVKVIEAKINNPGKYSYFDFLGYCGKHKLKKVVKDIHRFIDLLS